MSSVHHKNDNDLAKGLAEGDTGSFEALFMRYRRQSHYFVKGKVYSDEVAKEIVQEVFADIWHYRRERKIHHFSSYLFQALKYKTIKYINQLINQKNTGRITARFCQYRRTRLNRTSTTTCW